MEIQQSLSKKKRRKERKKENEKKANIARVTAEHSRFFSPLSLSLSSLTFVQVEGNERERERGGESGLEKWREIG